MFRGVAGCGFFQPHVRTACGGGLGWPVLAKAADSQQTEQHSARLPAGAGRHASGVAACGAAAAPQL